MFGLKFITVLGFALNAAAYPVNEKEDVGLPLILTPYIQSGNIEEAQRLALVTGLTPNITSYAGFFNVDEDCGSNMFFWYFPSQTDVEKNPVTLWLQGGPGSSSLFGLFIEHGPYELTLDLQLQLREYSWNRESSVLYIDNPVGTGFSFAKNTDCYSRNQSQVAENAVKALEQFFEMFPNLKANPFFLSGESYAGKYVPSIGNRIHQGPTTIKNLAGILIGNGMIDPPNASNYSRLYFELGLIDSKTRDDMAAIEKQIQVAVQNSNYTEAFILRNDKLLNETFAQRAGYKSFYNFLYSKGKKKADYGAFVSRSEIRQAIHVGNATWHDDSYDVSSALVEDIMRSAVPNLVPLMDNYNTLLFYGQLDLRDPYSPSINFIQNLNWTGSSVYESADRYIYYVDDELVGYGKSAKSFTEFLLRNAGHMAPFDQPKWAFSMYNDFVHGRPLNKKHLKKDVRKNRKMPKKFKSKRNKSRKYM